MSLQLEDDLIETLTDPRAAHWLAVEGVQPSIPQNPTSSDQRHQELLPKGAGANPNLVAVSGIDNVSVKPLVKHVISKELQLYFERICGAILDESNDEYRAAAFASLRMDPGLHQLVPYFIHFVADKVTHNMKSLFVLNQMLDLLSALLDNPSLYISPYISSLVPSVLTCLIGKHLGNPTSDAPIAHYTLRDLSASLLSSISKNYGQTASTLKPRIARSCLKAFLDSHKPFGTHYGAVLGLHAVSGSAGVRALIVPNLTAYDLVLKPGLENPQQKEQAEMVVHAILKALESLEDDAIDATNGHPEGEELKSRLTDVLGETIGSRVYDLGKPALISAALGRKIPAL